jgi:hypothetical protein
MMTEPWMLYCCAAALLLFVGCAASTSAAPTASAELAKAQITVLYDAFGKASAMQKDWGYAAFDLSKLDFVVMSPVEVRRYVPPLPR